MSGRRSSSSCGHMYIVDSAKKFDTHFQKSILSQEGFMVSSTALQLSKSLWPSQILLVCRLGKGLATPETQTLPAPNHTPYGSRYTVEPEEVRHASRNADSAYLFCHHVQYKKGTLSQHFVTHAHSCQLSPIDSETHYFALEVNTQFILVLCSTYLYYSYGSLTINGFEKLVPMHVVPPLRLNTPTSIASSSS